MNKYSAFRIDTITLEKLRLTASTLERSMAGQVRYMVDRDFEKLQEEGRIIIGSEVLSDELQDEAMG